MTAQASRPAPNGRCIKLKLLDEQEEETKSGPQESRDNWKLMNQKALDSSRGRRLAHRMNRIRERLRNHGSHTRALRTAHTQQA